MAKTRYGVDRGLTRRMFGTMFGLGLLYVVLAAMLYAIGFNALFILGISSQFRLRSARVGLISVGVVILLYAVVLLASAPKPPF